MSISIANLRERYLESPLGDLHIYLGKLLAVYLLLVLGGAAGGLLVFAWSYDSYTVLEYVQVHGRSGVALAALLNWLPALILGSLWSRGVITRA